MKNDETKAHTVRHHENNNTDCNAHSYASLTALCDCGSSVSTYDSDSRTWRITCQIVGDHIIEFGYETDLVYIVSDEMLVQLTFKRDLQQGAGGGETKDTA